MNAATRAAETLVTLGLKVRVVRLPDDSALAGKTLAESRLGQALGLNVLAILRADENLLAPDPATILRPGDRLLVTASGLSKGFLSDDDLVVIRLDGELLPSYRGRGLRPSSEISMHLEVYRQRPDVSAVVHAHPPLASAAA